MVLIFKNAKGGIILGLNLVQRGLMDSDQGSVEVNKKTNWVLFIPLYHQFQKALGNPELAKIRGLPRNHSNFMQCKTRPKMKRKNKGLCLCWF